MVMQDRIFTLGLSVEAVSLYLILHDLEFHDMPLKRENIEPRWNAPPQTLEHALDELAMHQVVQDKSDPLILNPQEAWTPSRSA